MSEVDRGTLAHWQARGAHLEQELERITAQLELTQLIALALFFALAGVLAFR